MDGSVVADVAVSGLLDEYFNVPLSLSTYMDTKFGGLRLGEFRLSPSASVNLAGISKLLKLGGKVIELYGIYDTVKKELRSRGVGFEQLLREIKETPSTIAYALHSPDALLQALEEGVTSATAADLKFLTFGLSPLTGSDIQRALHKPDDY